MSWPLSQDYNEAVQNPARNFSDPDLSQGKAVTNALGIPMPCSGNFADVYQVSCPDGDRWAVKCFTRETPGLRERYQEITRHLVLAKLPFMVEFSYLDPGIRVAGKWYPVLKMQWVEGLTLNQFVAQNLDKPAALDALLQVWPRMAKALRAAQVGHCDLQHGNVLLVPGASANSLTLKLIDYDGMWVPGLAGTKSGEIGHASYQHPQRQREGTYSLDVDRFSVLLIATALSALKTGGRALWEKYDDGDNLLFRQPDLEAPNKSALFAELLKLEDRATRSLVEKLIDAARKTLEQAPLLEDVLPDARSVASSEAARTTPPATPPTSPVTEPVAESAFASFQPSSARPRRRQGKPAVWLAVALALGLGTVAALAVIVVNVLIANRPADSTKGPPVASKDTNADKIAPAKESKQPILDPKLPTSGKNTDPDGKKDKTDAPEKPAPLPRLAAFPKLSLPELGAADLQVKVERQGYVGPIKVQVENLPDGVTCQSPATIPAGESSVQIEFSTDGTAVEGTATVEVIVTAGMQIADRQKLALLLPPKSAASVKPPKPLPTTWKSLASMPTARSVLAAVTGPDGRIYAIGGENASGGLGTVEVYDPNTNKWTTVAPMPTARNHLAATKGPDNLIYAIGGPNSNIVEAYNPSTNKWTTVASMPTPRHGLAAVTGPDGRIYAIGGNGPSGTLNTVEAYDPTTNTWAAVANMPTARVYLAAVTGPDGRIYVIGGFQEGDGKRLNTVEAYDTKTNSWTTVASMTTARNAHAAATGPDGRIYALGGHTVGAMPNIVEAYNPSTNKWTPVANMPTVRGQLAATTGRDGRIYVIDGGGNVPFLNTVEALIFSSSK